MIRSYFTPLGSYSVPSGSHMGHGEANRDKTSIPIVLLHGWGCDDKVWQSLMPFLTKYADIITLEIRYSYKNVDACCEAIAKHLPIACILCGWSLGGMLATRLTGLYPLKIKALITLATNLSFVANKHWPHAMAPDVFNEFFEAFTGAPKKTLLRFALLQVSGDEDSKKQLAYLKRQSVSHENLLMGLNYLLSIDNTETLTVDVVCPALFVFGEKDALVPLAAANQIIRLVRAHQEVAIVYGRGHVLPYIGELAVDDMDLTDAGNKSTKKDKALLTALHKFLKKTLSSIQTSPIS